MKETELKFSKDDLKNAMEYGMGIICGIHTLQIDKIERDKHFDNVYKMISESQIKNIKR